MNAVNLELAGYAVAQVTLPQNEIVLLRRLDEAFCPVTEGGVMLMRPLLLHAPSRTVVRAGIAQ